MVVFNIRISCFEEDPPDHYKKISRWLGWFREERLTKQVDSVVECCCSRFPPASGKGGRGEDVPGPRPSQHLGGVQGDGGVAPRHYQHLQGGESVWADYDNLK